MSLKNESNSLSSNSTCETAVSHSGHQMVGDSVLYSLPISYNSMNESCEIFCAWGEMVEYNKLQSTDIPMDCQIFLKCSSAFFVSSRQIFMNSFLSIFVAFIPLCFSTNFSVGSPLSSKPNG